MKSFIIPVVCCVWFIAFVPVMGAEPDKPPTKTERQLEMDELIADINRAYVRKRERRQAQYESASSSEMRQLMKMQDAMEDSIDRLGDDMRGVTEELSDINDTLGSIDQSLHWVGMYFIGK